MTLIIDSQTFNIPVLSISRTADFLSKYAERSEDGVLHTELLAIYFNYRLILGQTTDTAEYARLWAKLTEATEYHEVTVPDESTTPYTFTAYFSNVSDELRKVQGSTNYWKNLTVNFTAQSPAETP